MLAELLSREESKTLEFKENTQSLQKIVQTIIAFANTAGGTLVVGVKDKSKDVIGLEDVLADEEKIANAIADLVAPLLIPNFHPYTWRDRDVLIVVVSHQFGPYYLKTKGLDQGTFVRLGSTNRIADEQTITEIKRLKEHKFFDEQPNFSCPLELIKIDEVQALFDQVSKKINEQSAQSLGLVVTYQGKKFPSNGAVLLFADSPQDFFPDILIRLGRFVGTDKSDIIDHKNLNVPLSKALDPILMFIKQHTSMGAKFTATRRIDIPQYHPLVIREAIINALVHSDYSSKAGSITIAIFHDRIEITNPGILPFGLSLEAAMSGVSQLRNKVIGRVFRELNLIEQWGSGLERMVKICKDQGIQTPKYEELANFFRVTLYHAPLKAKPTKLWQLHILEYLKKHKEITPKIAQRLWKVTTRTTTSRLKEMCATGLLVEISTSSFDPYKIFCLPEGKN